MLNIFDRWKEKQRLKETALNLYRRAVTQAREITFYRDFSVPDTVDGRFEMIAMHVFIIMHRLENPKLSQELFDVMFQDMEQAMRQMGIGDLSVPRQVKRMMRGFKGRYLSYKKAVSGEESLERALKRNIYGTIEGPSAKDIRGLEIYLLEMVRLLGDQTDRDLTDGRVMFKDISQGLRAA